jgi:hypothetical protein
MSRLEHDSLCDEGDWTDMCDECRAQAERFLPDTMREDD